MKEGRFQKRIASLWVMLLLAACAAPALADRQETFRSYDAKGQRTGTIRQTEVGRLRFYDRKGQLTGTARQERSGDWRLYDIRGRYLGRARNDEN
jgi:hypothetical protein